MATITEPMALDKTFNTTETTPRSQADVLAGIEQAIVRGFGQVANAVSYDNTDSGLTADNVQDAIDEVDDTVDGLVDDVTEISNNIESTQTATGNPITLTDAAPINAESLVVELEPQQDLHGQSAPYVGGTGENKLGLSIDTTKAENPGSWNGNKITIDNGSVEFKTNGGFITECILNSATSSRFNITVSFTLKAGTYIYSSGFSEILYTTDSFLTLNDVAIARGNSSSPGQTFTLEQDSTLKWVLRTYDTVNTNVVVKPMIRLSTETDPTFAPFSNICPITGYTECEVDDVGKNLFDKTSAITDKLIDENGPEITSYSNFHSDYIRVKGNESYYLSNVFGGSSFHTSIHYDENKNLIGVKYVSGSGNQSGAITTFENSAYMIVNGQRAHIDEMQVTVGSDAPTTYEPYHSSNATIQFGQTVYGGSVDFLTGVLTVDRGIANPKDCTVAKNSSSATDYLYYIVASSLPESANLSNSDKWKSSHMRMYSSNAPGNFYPNSSFGVVYMNLGDVIGTNTVDGFKQYCTNNNVQIAYPLAAPFTIQLTPDELKLLKGTNNLTTNGTTINLGYQPDNVVGEVKGEIEKCAVDAEFMQFTDGTDTFTDVNLSLDASLHTVSVVGSKIEQKRFICFEVMDKMGGVLQGILASCIAFTDGAKTPSGTAFRAYIESLQMYVNFRIYGSGGSYTLAYQSATSFSASAFYVRVRMMNNL